ncbi:hypothetical protein P7F88_19405 [Vibrio hannami]|uniref:hypothetical protein n=1 Tax=Vibrio hannami TaxID=2717094 RepID=UPI00240EF36B|nr:hypothetical protein [Vibrio hannami]MDG3088124.1 hypothetical protein [Vibrio hannami]
MQAVSGNKLTDFTSPLVSLFGAANFLSRGAKKDESVQLVSDGFNQMFNGLLTLLKGAEQILDQKIDQVLTEERSVLTDDDIEGFAQFKELLNVMRPMILEDEAGLPEDFRRSIAKVVERGEMLANLERQFREQPSADVVPIDIAALQKENQEIKEDIGGWTEA